MSVQTDFSHASTAEEKRKILQQHLSLSTGHGMPKCVTCVAVFCDELHFPGLSDVVLVEIQGYVQTKNTVTLTTMQRWINSASWKPVPRGLMSDDDASV